MSQCSKQILHFQCSTSVMANVTGDWTVAWLSLSICSFSTKIKSTLLRIMEIKVLVQTKTSLAQIHVFCDTFAVPQTCLFLKPGFWIVWQIQDLLCWNVHLEANTKMTPQMFVNSLSNSNCRPSAVTQNQKYCPIRIKSTAPVQRKLTYRQHRLS